jgi:uncharacterized protein YgiB involved in biofilm formation
MRRKSSLRVTLVLIGIVAGAGIAGCSPGDNSKRDVYSNRDDCKRDWGDETKCEPVRDGRYSSSYYYGPSYTGTRPSIAGSGGRSLSVGTVSTSRGGFGSMSSFHSSGG